MKHTLFSIVAFTAYTLSFLAIVIGIAERRKRQRKERLPINFRLLRGPGETLRKKHFELEEFLYLKALIAPLVPAIAGGIAICITDNIDPSTPLIRRLLPALLVFIGSTFLVGYWLLRQLRTVWDYRLGYFGERAVADEIASLVYAGYHIFHDVPARAGNREFNIDHVVVGPTGVFAIETKTRRKRSSNTHQPAHEVKFDGTRLIWPSGSHDETSIAQAIGQARWTRDWLAKVTGLPIEVLPVLALPGWMVREAKIDAVRVLNPKNIPPLITNHRGKPLAPAEIALIARQLDERCRDVEY